MKNTIQWVLLYFTISCMFQFERDSNSHFVKRRDVFLRAVGHRQIEFSHTQAHHYWIRSCECWKTSRSNDAPKLQHDHENKENRSNFRCIRNFLSKSSEFLCQFLRFEFQRTENWIRWKKILRSEYFLSIELVYMWRDSVKFIYIQCGHEAALKPR